MTDLFDAPFPKTQDFAEELRKSMKLISSVAPAPSASPTLALADALSKSIKAQEVQQKKQAKALKDDPAQALSLVPIGWDQVRTGMPNFDALPYSQQLEAHNQYVKGAVEATIKKAPGVDEVELAAQLRKKFPAPAAPERSLLESVEDKGRAFAAGVGGFVSTLAGAASPDFSGVGQRSLDDTISGIQAGSSAVRQDEMKQEAFERTKINPNDPLVQRLWEEAKLAGRNLSLDDVANLLGSAAPTVLIGAGVGAGVSKLAAAGGATAVRAAAAGRVAGTGVAGALEGASTGGDAARQAFDAVQALPLETLQRADGWAQAVQDAAGDEVVARAQLAEQAALRARAIGFVAGTGLSLLPGSLEGAAARVASRAAAGQTASRTAGNALTRVAGNAVVEGVTEASGDVAAQQGKQTVDPEAKLTGAGESFLLGLLGGAVIGGPLELAAGRQTAGRSPSAAPSPADIIGEPAGAAPPAGGGTITIRGATLVPTAEGGWAYAPGIVPNPSADSYIARTRTPTVEGQAARVPPTALSPEAISEGQAAAPQLPPEVSGSLVQFGYAPDQIARMTPAAADFNVGFRKALIARQVPLEQVNRIEQAIGRLTDGLAPMSLATNQQTLTNAQALIRTPIASGNYAIADAINVALQDLKGREIGSRDGSPIGFIAGQLGYGDTLQGNTEAWAETVRSGKGNAVQTLEALVSGENTPAATREAASTIVQLYKDSGVPVPKIKVGTQLKEKNTGQYDTSKNDIRIGRAGDGNTVVHESLHGLTANGLLSIEYSASTGDPFAQSFVALLTDIRKKIRAQETTQQYGTSAKFSDGSPNLHEMFAELMSPAFLSMATQVEYGQPSAEARLAFDTLNAKPDDTLFDMIVRSLKTIVEYIAPGSQIAENSVASILARAVSHSIGKTAEITNVGPAATAAKTFDTISTSQPATIKMWRGTGGDPNVVYTDVKYPIAGKGTYYTSTKDQAELFGDSVQQHSVAVTNPLVIDSDAAFRTLTKAAGWPYPNLTGLNEEQITRYAESLSSYVRETLGHDALVIKLKDPKQFGDQTKTLRGVFSTDTLIDYNLNAARRDGVLQQKQLRSQQAMNQGANNSTQPMPSQRESMPTVIDGIATGTGAPPATPMRGFVQAAKKGDRQAMRAALADLGRAIDEKAHDHLRSWVDWSMALPISDGQKRTLIGAMRLAPGIRDQLLRFARTEYGDPMFAKLGKMANKTGRTAETTEHYAGYWVTARRAETGNQQLIDKAVKKLDTLEKLAQRKPTRSNINAANTAQVDLDGLIVAVNNPDTKVKTHTYGVAGMSNPQARELMAAVERKFDKADLESVAQSLYDLNGWNLMVAISSGKASPGVVAEFLGRKDLLRQFKELRAASDSIDASDPNSFDRVNTLMRDLQAEIASQYVPLTGNPDTALDEEMIQSGTNQPNITADREMLGRTSSAPDNAIRATIGALVKNASYSGWFKFQDAIASAYTEMSPEEREAAGLHRQDVKDTGNRIGENAIVRRRGTTTHAYYFKNQKLLPALRNAYILEGDKLLWFFGRATKLYAYFATQANPIFAPKNLPRDMYERTENMRTREYFNADGDLLDSTRMARQTFWWLSPHKLPRLVKVGAKFGLGWKLTGKTVEERYLQEFVAAGGASVFGDKFNRNSADIALAINGRSGNLKSVWEGAKKWIEGYNRGFDMAPALAAYITMRENGMTRDDAASGTLDLMNFRKKGESMTGINSLWAFAQPAVTGGANLLQYLRTPRGRVRLVVQALILLVIQAAARKLAEDDEGGNRLDQQSDSTHAANLLLPYGDKDKVLKLPLAFGHARLANSMARALLGFSLSEGETKDLGEAAGTLIGNGVVPAFSPFEDTDIDWSKRPLSAAAMLLAPSILKPPTSVVANRKASGSQVVSDKFEDPTRYRSEQFGKRTPDLYKDVAIELRQISGIDLAPEEIQAFIRGYPLGVGNMMLTGLVENPFKEEKALAAGKDANTISPLMAAVFSPYSDVATYFSFRDAIEESDELTRQQQTAEAKEQLAKGIASVLSARDQRLMDWRQRWEKQDLGFRSKKAQITRAKGISEEARERRKGEVDEARKLAQREALFLFRTEVQGLDAKRTAP